MHGTARGAMYSTVIHFSLIQRDVAGSPIQRVGKDPYTVVALVGFALVHLAFSHYNRIRSLAPAGIRIRRAS